MLKRWIILLQIVCMSMVTYGQLIWEVSGNGAEGKSYLLATNRYVDMQFLDTIPNLFQYFGRCDKVITEFTMEDYQAIQALRQAAVLPDSVGLRALLTEEQYQQVDQALLLTLKMGLSQLCRMKPAYLCELYRNELFKQSMQYDEKRTMEVFFALVAQQKSMPIYGLDGVGETMYMFFDREPIEQQCKDLMHAITYPEQEVSLEQSIVQLYRHGLLTDIMYQVTSPDNKSSLSYSDYQVYAQRNQTWVKRLAPYLKEGKAFVTLNAMYLCGEKGLISQLRAAGYKVKAANKSRADRPLE